VRTPATTGPASQPADGGLPMPHERVVKPLPLDRSGIERGRGDERGVGGILSPAGYGDAEAQAVVERSK